MHTVTQKRPTVQMIGERFRQLRIDAGLTLANQEHRTGIKASLMGSYERGERSMPIETLVALAGVYGVAPADMLRDVPRFNRRRGTDRRRGGDRRS